MQRALESWQTWVTQPPLSNLAREHRLQIDGNIALDVRVRWMQQLLRV
jgi:hypothetical protein